MNHDPHNAIIMERFWKREKMFKKNQTSVVFYFLQNAVKSMTNYTNKQ